MSKSSHRAPAAGLRQWAAWAVAALVVTAAYAFVSPLGGEPVSKTGTFLLLLLCFATGSLASSMFLSRPLRRGGHLVFPAVREPEAIEQAPAESSRSSSIPVHPRTSDSEEDWIGGDAPAFRSSEEADGPLEVAVRIAGGDGSEQQACGDLTGLDLAGLSEISTVATIPVQKTRERTDEAETPAEEWESAAYPGAVKAKANGQSPDSDYRVKGNTRSKRYHTMQSPYYERTKAGVWFRSAADAERAGFSAWNSRVKNGL